MDIESLDSEKWGFTECLDKFRAEKSPLFVAARSSQNLGVLALKQSKFLVCSHCERDDSTLVPLGPDMLITAQCPSPVESRLLAPLTSGAGSFHE